MRGLQAAPGTALTIVAGTPRVARLAMVATALFGLGVDQLTKCFAVTHLDPVNPPRLLGGLVHLQLIRNPGAAFSMGSSATIAISCLAIAASVVMVGYVGPRLANLWQGVLAGFALAGILGNLTDRIFRAPAPLRGHVVDFVQLPHFAIFNVADIFLTSTAVVVVLMNLRSPRQVTSSDVTAEEGS